MSRFEIERGHDGPARRGRWVSPVGIIETPFLLGPPNIKDVDAVYIVPDHDILTQVSQPTVLVMPTLLSGRSAGEDILSERSPLVAAPSVVGASAVSSEMVTALIREQLHMAGDHDDPSRVVLRLPPIDDMALLGPLVTEAHNIGVRAALLQFDGMLGRRDLNSVIIRSMLPRNWLTIAVGSIEPCLVPLLSYIGIDGFDVSRADEAARRHERLWQNGTECVTSIHDARFCACTACTMATDSAEGDLESVLRGHNIHIYRTVLSEAVHARSRGLLRWLVESMTHVSPGMATFLRRVDRAVYPYIEEFTPTVGPSYLPLIGPESYHAAAVARFRQRLAERYSPPEDKQIVLLLPCSARKPYSESRSHRRFIETIESALQGARSAVAEVVITSPLGVVPRELERLYPAAQYDIPVTGDWDAEEIRIAAEALRTHLSKFSSDVVVVAHTSGGYADVLRAAQDDIDQSIIYTIQGGSATSDEALESLRETLSDVGGLLGLQVSYEGRSDRRRRRPRNALVGETLRATADFQFGPGAGSLLVPDSARLRGRLYATVTCTVEGQQLCSYVGSTGLLSLTLAGARRISSLGNYWVRFDGETLRGGSLFAVAVTDADPLIRPGDEVIVLNTDGEVVGVGRSEMSGREMCEFDNGRAVSIRHKE